VDRRCLNSAYGFEARAASESVYEMSELGRAPAQATRNRRRTWSATLIGQVPYSTAIGLI